MDLSYDGTNYHGWQNQPNAISVQSCIEKALSLLTKVETQIFGAGRTDSGVHAIKMCAHFDSNLLVDLSKLIYDLNSFLPKDVLPTEPLTEAAGAGISFIRYLVDVDTD